MASNMLGSGAQRMQHQVIKKIAKQQTKKHREYTW